MACRPPLTRRRLWSSSQAQSPQRLESTPATALLDLEREQMLKGWAVVKRTVFFWQGKARPVEADESLNTLLARREQVRSTRTTAGSEPREPREELFKPQETAKAADFPLKEGEDDSGPQQTEPTTEAKPAETDAPAGTTSRLLEAKRRAQKRREG